MMLAQDAQVRLRLPPVLRILPVIVVLPGVVLYLQSRVGHGHYPNDHADGPSLLLFLLVIAIVAVALNRWFGITLDQTEARIHNLRRTTIAWSRVQAISEEWFVGAKRVVLWTDDGRRIPLRTPVTLIGHLGGRRFDRDYHRIGQWWLDHRGPNWRPIPPELRRQHNQ